MAEHDTSNSEVNEVLVYVATRIHPEEPEIRVNPSQSPASAIFISPPLSFPAEKSLNHFGSDRIGTIKHDPGMVVDQLLLVKRDGNLQIHFADGFDSRDIPISHNITTPVEITDETAAEAFAAVDKTKKSGPSAINIKDMQKFLAENDQVASRFSSSAPQGSKTSTSISTPASGSTVVGSRSIDGKAGPQRKGFLNRVRGLGSR